MHRFPCYMTAGPGQTLEGKPAFLVVFRRLRSPDSSRSGDNAVMCGRYVSPEQAEIERFWHIGRHNSNPFARRFNVSPTSIIPILRLDRSTGEIKQVKQPHFFHLSDVQLCAFAGVMAMWKPANDDEELLKAVTDVRPSIR